MKKKSKFFIKQGVKYTIIFLMVIGAILFYSLISSMPKADKIVVLSTIIGIVLVALIIDIISIKDIWGIFGK